ncbi:Por secretion system C-terminal sorting domain-containing protein [Flexibacter flexilis DSM 6793]|uniref:Por secretion system C-terminal sorting domain-containing protein n=1 Tax=Flexibacter flexilis DSM 6793 TaxID=927664 RepID=A0A1I1DF35_9BACT|nr:T9SS type A sorting domain-containing protein [Flexibacter flexilis]SFB71133.1 Por secretion system C-terminal sorting domain-containing protein [Flexibacter flexilis DSM 6793]
MRNAYKNKNYWLLILLLLAPLVSFGQGTTCGGSTSLTVNGAGVTATINDATINGTATVCGRTVTREGWYSFTLASFSDVTITLAANRNPAIQLLSGTCASLTEVSCANNGGSGVTETLTLSLAAGTYHVRVVNVGKDNNMSVSSLTVVASACTAPTASASAPSPASGSTLTGCAAPTLSWTAPALTGCKAATGYDVYFGTAATPTTLVSSNQGLTSYSPSGLSSSTTYYWQIVPRNSYGAYAKASCPVWSFTTSATVVSNTPNITENFESTCFPWTIVNGSQTNKWVVGTATKNAGAKSIYISNDGSSNAYDVNATSVVHFYRDITFPVNQCYNLSFYYKGQGEGSYDYLRVYLVPVTTTITAGTQLASGQIGTTYNVQDAYSQVSLNLDNAAIAGTTQRLVFSWRNDASLGTQPPISIDDIAITASLPSVPVAAATISSPANGAANLCSVPTLAWTAPSNTGCNATTGYDVYLQTNSTTFTTPVSTNQTATNYISASALPIGTYYWKIVPRNSAGAYPIASCPVWSFSVGAGTADNDVACTAINLPLGVNLGGDNSCANGTGEPAAPGAWTAGNLNTVWYKVTAPASGRLKIRTTLGTLANTQIQLFSATSCSGTFTSIAANDDAPTCGSSSYTNSEITATGLTAGATYYIRVDGYSNQVGTFNIMAVDGSGSFPTSAGQACSASVPVCNSSMTIGNPGYQGIGYECDFASAGCLSSGERGSVWYKIPVNAAGQLIFSIIPNDYDGVVGDETDYDFAIWKVKSSVLSPLNNDTAVACSSISDPLDPPTPLRCNYSYLGVTGVDVSGNAPSAYPGYDAAYELPINVVSGEEYLLVISNYTNSTSGFTITFDDVSPVAYPTAASVSSVTWTGSIDTDWFKKENWGGCEIPNANIDAQISPSAANQPIITGNATCKSLIINLDAKVTIGLGGRVDIYGDYNNAGILTALPTTTMRFLGTAAQTLIGNLINESALPNVTINKTAGSVTQQQDMELNSTFTIANGVYNANSKRLTVGGNFTNNATFSPGTGGILEFDGTADQTYTNAGIIDLENVVINNGGGVGVYVNLGSNMILSNTATLMFTLGSIKTTTSYEVRVKNRAVGAVSSAAGSYVWGYLRRFVNSTGSYTFPLGVAQANPVTVNFTGSTTIDNLRGRFGITPSYTVPFAAVIAEASTVAGCNQPTYNQDGGRINTGTWEVSAFNSALTQITGDGTYTISITANGFTNGGKYATIAKNGALSGTRVGCSDPSSGSVTVSRSGLSGFSEFDIVQAADGTLPVTLLSLRASSKGHSIGVYWATAQEQNNAYFEVLRSTSNSGETVVISKVSSFGDSREVHNYYYEDKNVESGVVYYYSLRQVDRDGGFSLSHKVHASLGMLEEGGLTLYPNPMSSAQNCKLELLLPQSDKVEVTVTDVLGRPIYRHGYELAGGFHILELPTKHLKTGTYHVTLLGDNIYETTKLIIVK